MKLWGWLVTSLLACVAPAQAQSEDWTTDWTTEKQANGTLVAKHKSGRAMVFVGGKKGSADQIDDQIRALTGALPQCGATASTPIRQGKTAGSRELVAQSGLVRCRFVSGFKDGFVLIIVGIEPVTGPEDADQMVDRLAVGLLGSETPPMASAPPAQPRPSPQASLRSADTLLKAAIDAVPLANRPIGTAFRSAWDSVSMSMAYTPWVLFQNGIAADADCPHWNPRGARPGTGCETTSWRRVGPDKIQFGGDDDPISAGGFYGFTPGQRMTANMSRTGGGGVSGANTVNGGTLRLTASGTIAVGRWNGVALSGSNYSGYSGNGGTIRGRYFLSGFLIAIQDEGGRTSLGFIAGKRETGGNYLFLNGKQYWD
jgi:hypothetical protein